MRARRLARRCNELSASLTQRWPDRLGGFAALPLADVDGARAADDVLNLDGVVLFSNANGVYLGDDRFEPLLTQVGRRFERNSTMIWLLEFACLRSMAAVARTGCSPQRSDASAVRGEPDIRLPRRIAPPLTHTRLAAPRKANLPRASSAPAPRAQRTEPLGTMSLSPLKNPDGPPWASRPTHPCNVRSGCRRRPVPAIRWSSAGR
jgi:hypothetical protein